MELFFRYRNALHFRLGVESFFRKLKYMIGLSNFHSYKPQYIEQEIWAKLITYNIMETVINYIVLETNDTNMRIKSILQ